MANIIYKYILYIIILIIIIEPNSLFIYVVMQQYEGQLWNNYHKNE